MHFAGLFQSKCTRERTSNAFRWCFSLKMHSRRCLECISLVFFSQNALERGSRMHFTGLFHPKCTREGVSNAFRWCFSIKMHSRKDLECISLVFFNQNALEKVSRMHFVGLFQSKCTRERISNAFSCFFH